MDSINATVTRSFYFYIGLCIATITSIHSSGKTCNLYCTPIDPVILEVLEYNWQHAHVRLLVAMKIDVRFTGFSELRKSTGIGKYRVQNHRRRPHVQVRLPGLFLVTSDQFELQPCSVNFISSSQISASFADWCCPS